MKAMCSIGTGSGRLREAPGGRRSCGAAGLLILFQRFFVEAADEEGDPLPLVAGEDEDR